MSNPGAYRQYANATTRGHTKMSIFSQTPLILNEMNQPCWRADSVTAVAKTVGPLLALLTKPSGFFSAFCSSGSKHLTTIAAGQKRFPLGPGVEGPSRLVATKGYSTTMALSTLNHLLVGQKAEASGWKLVGYIWSFQAL